MAAHSLQQVRSEWEMPVSNGGKLGFVPLYDTWWVAVVEVETRALRRVVIDSPAE